MLLIANLIRPAQQRVDQMNTFPVVGLGRKKKKSYWLKKENAVKGNVNVSREMKEIEKKLIIKENKSNKIIHISIH